MHLTKAPLVRVNYAPKNNDSSNFHGSVRSICDVACRPRYLPLFLTLIYFCFAAIVATHHEMWRDELQAWMIARDSIDLPDLLNNLRYEGHPPLWHLLLFILTRITHDPSAMAVLHLMIATLAMLVVFWRSPFSVFEKALMIFSYFLFFEYAVISRNYGIGVLFIFLASEFFRQRHSRPWLLAACVALLAWTSILGAIVSIVITAAILGETLWIRRHTDRALHNSNSGFVAILAFAATAIALSIAIVVPPADSGFAEGWNSVFRTASLEASIDRMVSAYVPLPPWGGDFWNRNALLAQDPMRSVTRIIVPAIAIIYATALIRRPVVLFLFAGTTVGLLLFFETKNLNNVRHHGFLFIVLVMSEWLRRTSDAVVVHEAIGKLSKRFEALVSWTFVSLLAFQAVAGATAAALEVRHAFSNAKVVSAFLRQSGLAQRPIIGFADYAASAVAGFLPEIQIYYPQGQRQGSFIIWDRKRFELVSDTFAKHGGDIMSHQLRDEVYLLNFALEPAQAFQYGLALRAHFTGAVVADENYFIYERR